MGENVYKIGPK